MSEGEKLAFSRKASGMVRGLSLYDAIGIALMTTVPIWAIWFTIELGLGLYSGANLIITVLISAAMIGIFGPLVWGILAGSMPRSGGEYIYNSRVLHPAIALGASFAQVVAVTYWSFIQTTWMSAPALQMIAEYLGLHGLANFVTNKWGIVAISLLTDISIFVLLIFGMKVYKRVQKPITAVAILGPIALAIILTLASKAGFIHQWNELAAQYHSLNYASFTRAVGHAAGKAMPSTWNWHDTLGATCGAFALFVYTYTIGYVGGEVKSPAKTLMYAQWIAMWVPVAIALWTFAALYRVVDFNFLSATAYANLNGPPAGYTFPYAPSYFTLVWVAGGSVWVAAVIAGGTFLLTNFAGIAVNMIVLNRSTFAWGLDRMGPKWFTDMNPRWASPVKLYAFFLVIIVVGTVLYQVVSPSALAGLTASGMQEVSVFLITGVSAILLPFRKSVRGVWESSPYRGWKFLGIPLVSIAGAVYCTYICFLLYFAFLSPKTKDITGKNAYVFIAAWVIGVSMYFYWRWHNARQGLDSSLTFGQLPPE